MLLPEELDVALKSAAEGLASHPRSELILPQRKRIWAALGPCLMDKDGIRAVHGIGLQRRTTLAILCARHVRPVWEQVWPNDDDPHQMIKTAELYLNQALDFDSVEERKNQYLGKLDNLLSKGEHEAAINVGFAAGRAVFTALHDEDFDPHNIDDDLMDEDLDVNEWDASFNAAAAYAGGFPWEENSSSTRRREFWEWYLNEAVPLAWTSAS